MATSCTMKSIVRHHLYMKTGCLLFLAPEVLLGPIVVPSRFADVDHQWAV